MTKLVKKYINPENERKAIMKIGEGIVFAVGAVGYIITVCAAFYGACAGIAIVVDKIHRKIMLKKTEKENKGRIELEEI